MRFHARRINIGTALASRLCYIAFGLTPWNQAFGHCKIQLFDLPVAVVHNRALLSGEINGQPIKIFVDTGSVTSFIWRSETNRLGLAVLDSPNIAMAAGGSVHVQHALVKQLALGKLTAAGVDLIVVDREKPRHGVYLRGGAGVSDDSQGIGSR
ncbi:MAG TPA: retropepsin-like aspartic protease [Steroidobacteraceae bacterium]|nr:retropepsin-like aspartic protease [Steroidobacteraceae bacterium]